MVQVASSVVFLVLEGSQKPSLTISTVSNFWSSQWLLQRTSTQSQNHQTCIAFLRPLGTDWNRISFNSLYWVYFKWFDTLKGKSWLQKQKQLHLPQEAVVRLVAQQTSEVAKPQVNQVQSTEAEDEDKAVVEKDASLSTWWTRRAIQPPSIYEIDLELQGRSRLFWHGLKDYSWAETIQGPIRLV